MAKTKDAHFYATARLSENIVQTPEGYLLCIGVPIARTGTLFYAQGELLNSDGEEVIEPLDGVIEISRDADALFNVRTMASFEGKAVTLGHPDDFVNPSNWAIHANGHMQNVRMGQGEDSDKLLADLLVVTDRAISLIQSGLREVSLGYDAVYEQLAPGRGRQTGIVGNHVALVRRGRNGSEVAVRDSAPEIQPKSAIMTAKEKLMKMLGRAIDEAMPDTDKAPAADATPPVPPSNEPAAPETPPADAAPEEGDFQSVVNSRLETIETAMAKILELMSANAPATPAAAPVADAAPNGVIVEDENKDGKTEDAAPPAAVTSDAETLARAEILVPGIKDSGTLIKDALTQFGATESGAAILKTFDGISDEAAKFLAVAELVKVQQSSQLRPMDRESILKSLSGTTDSKGKGPMTAEEINAANKLRYGKA